MDDILFKIDKNLGSKFEKHLKAHGISYSHLARQADLSPSYVRKLCKGILVFPEISRVKMNQILNTNY